MSDAPLQRPTGAAPSHAEAADALAPGTRLGEFEIREVIGAGGFGIVYRAWDTALEREVAVKEFMPVTLAGRGADARVTLRSRGNEVDFALGLRSFVNEARLLARFDHPSLVKVHRFWESNATAYMAMPFYRGQTLRQLRTEMGSRAPDEAWARSLIDPLLGALEVLHRANVFHRDIAPDNILWCDDGRPVLLDFGAARHVLADRTQSLTAILKPQFAPIEQYADTQSMRQGPWTDLFGLASTCYYMLTGRAPTPATARVLEDELAPLALLAPPGVSPRLLEALDWAMAVRPQDRPQSVAALLDVLEGRAPLPVRDSPKPSSAEVGTPPAPEAFEKTVALTRREPRTQLPLGAASSVSAAAPRAGRRWPVAGAAAVLLAGAVGAAAWMAESPRTAPQPQASPERPTAAPGLPVPAASAEVTATPAASVATADAMASAVPAGPVASEQALAAVHRSRPSKTVRLATSGPEVEPPAQVAAIDQSRNAAANEVATASAVPTATSQAASAAGRRRTLREICVDEGAQNVAACVKLLCDTAPRFANYPACVHLRQKQASEAATN